MKTDASDYPSDEEKERIAKAVDKYFDEIGFWDDDDDDNIVHELDFALSRMITEEDELEL